MRKLIGLSLVFCFGLYLTSASVRADESDGYLIKLKTHPDIDKPALVQEQTTMHSLSKLVGREEKKILENNEDKQTQFFKFRETILEHPKGQDEPTRLRREYEKAEMEIVGVKTVLPLNGKTILIEKQKDRYRFSVEGGQELTGQDAERLADEFPSTSGPTPKFTDLIPADKAVRVDDNHDIDPKVLLKVYAKGLTDAGIKFDAAKLKGSWKLTRAYQKDGRQFGVIELHVEFPLREMRSTHPKATEQLVMQPGAKMTFHGVIDGCIDGRLATATSKMDMEINGTARVPSPDDPQFDLILVIKTSTKTTVEESIAFPAADPPQKDKKLDGLISAVFSPDGFRVAAVSDGLPGYPNTLKVWDVATGKLALAIPAPKKFLRSVLFTPDGKQLISSYRYLSSNDGSWLHAVMVWDASSGKAVRTLEPHQDQVQRLLLNGDGERLFALSWNPSMPLRPNEIKCWHLPTGRELFAIRQAERGRDPEKDVGYSIQLQYAELSPDGRHLAAPCDPGAIKVWDAGTGKELLSVAHPFRHMQPIAFTPDGKRFAAVDHKSAEPAVIVWEVATGKRATLASLDREPDVWAVAFSPDGKRLALSGNTQVEVFDVGTAKRLHLFKTVTVVHHVAFSPDSKSLAAGCGVFDTEGDVKVWDLASGKLLHVFGGQRGFVQAVAFNRDGSRLMSFNQVSLMLWSLDSR